MLGYDLGDRPEYDGPVIAFIKRRHYTCRKHGVTCSNCKLPITVGTLYTVWAFVEDGKFKSVKHCSDCQMRMDGGY